jgi:hypothetical protein
MESITSIDDKIDTSPPKRPYVITKLNRKKQGPRLSGIRREIYDEFNEGRMDVETFNKITYKKRNSASNFVRYHKFGKNVLDVILHDLYRTKPEDLEAFSVSQTYLLHF